MRTTENEVRRLSLTQLLTEANETWHGVKINQPDWSDGSHCLALHAHLRHEGIFFHFMLNAYWKPFEFELPRLDAGLWRRWIDTDLESPDDIVLWEQASDVSGNSYRVADHSVVMLYTRSNDFTQKDKCYGKQNKTEICPNSEH